MDKPHTKADFANKVIQIPCYLNKEVLSQALNHEHTNDIVSHGYNQYNLLFILFFDSILFIIPL